MKRVLLFLLTTCAAFGAVTDVVIPQRDSNGRNQYITITGSSNTWEAVGFNGSGVLTSLPLFNMTPSTGRTAGKILAVASGDLSLEWIAAPFADGDYGDITVGGSGTLMSIDAGSIVNADINASAAIAASKVADVGTTKSGTQAAPTTTNPLAPTWTTQDYIVYYGATGEIDLPAVASYTNKTLVIYCTGTFTITVDPNGSEIIVESGASLGAGTADVITGTAGLLVGYTCDGSRWIKLEGGGSGGGWENPAVEALDMGGFAIINAEGVTASIFSGAGSGLTGLPAAQLTGTIPDITTENLTSARSWVATPTAGVSNVVVTDDAETLITLDATTETLTYSATPPTGTTFRYQLTAHTSDCTVTIPSTYSFRTQSNRTSFIVRANKPAHITVWRTASAYYMAGDPLEVSELVEDTTPAITAKLEIDQGSGGEFSTIASIRDAIGTTFNGTAATPNTDNPETVAFNTLTFYHFSGATQELDLPAAAGYAGRGIAIRFDGSYTVTCDPNGSEVIDLNGTAMSAGEALIVTGTAGQIALLVSDGTSWATSGGNATYTQETP